MFVYTVKSIYHSSCMMEGFMMDTHPKYLETICKKLPHLCIRVIKYNSFLLDHCQGRREGGSTGWFCPGRQAGRGARTRNPSGIGRQNVDFTPGATKAHGGPEFTDIQHAYWTEASWKDSHWSETLWMRHLFQGVKFFFYVFSYNLVKKNFKVFWRENSPENAQIGCTLESPSFRMWNLRKGIIV